MWKVCCGRQKGFMSWTKHYMKKGAIGSQEYQQAKNNYDYYVQKKKLTDQIMAQDSSFHNAQQVNQDKQSLSWCPKSDECVEEKSQAT